jgi:hypothetical protein
MIVFGIVGFLGYFVPTTKEVAAIYMIPAITSNSDMKAIPANLAKLLNAHLEDWINDLAPVAKNKVKEKVEETVKETVKENLK